MARGKPKLSDEEWKEIRLRWEAGEKSHTLSKCGLWDISSQSIDKMAARHGWKRSLVAEVAQRTAEKLSDIGYDSTPEERDAAVDKLSDERVALVRKHREQWIGIDPIRLTAIAIYEGRPNDIMGEDSEGWDDPLKRLATANRVMGFFEKQVNGLTLAQEGERRAHGFDYKVLQGDKGNDPESQRLRKERIDGLLEDEAGASPQGAAGEAGAAPQGLQGDGAVPDGLRVPAGRGPDAGDDAAGVPAGVQTGPVSRIDARKQWEETYEPEPITFTG
jgi:hypothetical protein